ncbi:hypothetical protein HYH03_003560 [Edaphochlamys debaryana]|uniref:Apple domain-containing protein n=1 Tax=Edaphochlamys debaryana TaxID=47281 RepID=A0A835YAU1_9CHLO|nr:hypothetical protein HYH03_003560 [Edaphochlamys debaryana]|eukprot:KAG2498299.1 hypothetical protein HYH03_003560 [Edaphochlamys debaryana]
MRTFPSSGARCKPPDAPAPPGSPPKPWLPPRPGCRKRPEYLWDEAGNPGCPNRCTDPCQCDGLRDCSGAGFCQGISRPPYTGVRACTLAEGKRSFGGGFGGGDEVTDAIPPFPAPVSSVDDCLELCRRTGSCVTFVYNTGLRDCYMLRSGFTNGTEDASYSSGSCACPDLPGYATHPGELWGTPQEDSSASQDWMGDPAGAQSYCDQTPGCTAWSDSGYVLTGGLAPSWEPAPLHCSYLRIRDGTCPLPYAWWCAGAMLRDDVDCDGDGVRDLVCEAGSSSGWRDVLLSSRGCRELPGGTDGTNLPGSLCPPLWGKPPPRPSPKQRPRTQARRRSPGALPPGWRHSGYIEAHRPPPGRRRKQQ